MIASERSLPSAHQPQAQQRRQPSVTKSKNGITKPPIRPVKVYVLDPKTLQQRLEAYVGQKNKKEAESKIERESENKDDKTATSSVTTTTGASPLPIPALLAKTKATVVASKPPPPKQLQAIAPKISTVNNQTAKSTSNTEGGTVLGNGMTLQCITTSSFGIPSVPVVVTNGVALLQTPISQSAIQAGGLFLSGITPIPSTAIIGSTVNVKPKVSSPQKRKAKKRKAGKKKKLTMVDKEKEDYDESELEYLRKETTTRLGRVSRPSSRVPSPSHKRKKPSQTNVELVEFRCEACLQVYPSNEQLNLHIQECPQDRVIQGKTFPRSIISTNNQQGPLVPPPLSVSISDVQTNPVTISSVSTTVLSATSDKHTGTLLLSTSEMDACLRESTGSTYILSVNTTASTESSLGLNLPHTNEYIPESNNKRNSNSEANFSNYDNNVLPINCSKVSTNIENLNVSLVPNKEEPTESFQRRVATSNVGLVPSSYSIPSSPPSQCHSPGFPDNIHNSMAKQGTNSPERTCHSPVDPMLLHSRSPFPPPILETSQPSVSVSNFSIPEESLCRGELFMDLGEEGVLETTDIGRISPFCGSASERLFSNSPMKPASHLIDEASVPDIDLNVEAEAENGHESTPSHFVAPILTTEDANDGEIFQSANYARNFVHPSAITSSSQESVGHRTGTIAVTNSYNDFPKTPQSSYMESDVSMDSSEVTDQVAHSTSQKKRSVWQFVKEQIKSTGISQACGEISEMAEKLSRIARDQFIPIREEEIERMGNSSPIIQVDTPFFSHLLDLPFGTYVFKEDAGRKKKIPPPPPLTSSELSFTGGVDDVEKFLPSNIDLIALPHLTNLELI